MCGFPLGSFVHSCSDCNRQLLRVDRSYIWEMPPLNLHFYCLMMSPWIERGDEVLVVARYDWRLRKRNWQGWLSWRRDICTSVADIWRITVSTSTENETSLSTQLSWTLIEPSVLESAEPLSTNSSLLSQCQRNRLILPKITASFSRPTGCGGFLDPKK